MHDLKELRRVPLTLSAPLALVWVRCSLMYSKGNIRTRRKKLQIFQGLFLSAPVISKSIIRREIKHENGQLLHGSQIEKCGSF